MASESTAVDFDGPNDAPRLSQAELEDVRDAFQLFDTNNTQRVAVQDFLDVLKEMLQETTTSRRYQSQLQRLYDIMVSLPAERLLNESEFRQLLVTGDDDEDEIKKVFHLFSDGKDFIDVQDLQRVADELGESMSLSELEEMLAVEGNGNEENNNKVTLEQFAEIMNKKLLP